MLDFITHLLFLGKLIAKARFALQQTSKGYPVRLCYATWQDRVTHPQHLHPQPAAGKSFHRQHSARLEKVTAQKNPSCPNRKLFFEAEEKQELKSRGKNGVLSIPHLLLLPSSSARGTQGHELAEECKKEQPGIQGSFPL